MKPVPLAVAVVLLAAGGARAQPRSESEGADYFPLAQGTKWTYSVAGTEITQSVTGTDRIGDETCVKVETKAGGSTTAEWYARRPAGVFRVKTQNDVIDPAVKLVPAAIRIGDTWPVDALTGGQKLKGTFHVRKWEKVKTPAGEFTALLVESENLEIAGMTNTSMRMWYVRHVGMVRTEFVISGQTILLELTKFEAPPQK